MAECDETYFGGKRRRGVPGKRDRDTDKRPVLTSMNEGNGPYTELIPNCKKPILQAIIRGRVDPQATVVTECWRGYAGDVGYDRHIRLNHKQGEWSDGQGHHINGIENFWSFCKRRLAKFNGTRVNFGLHFKECEWRYKKTKLQFIKELIFLLRGSSLS